MISFIIPPRRERIKRAISEFLPITFDVTGSHGTLTADVSTGIVRELDEKHGDYAIIKRFDVAEWQAKYPGETLSGSSIDILDIGYWYVKDPAEGEQYEPPAEDWRNQINT